MSDLEIKEYASKTEFIKAVVVNNENFDRVREWMGASHVDVTDFGTQSAKFIFRFDEEVDLSSLRVRVGELVMQSDKGEYRPANVHYLLRDYYDLAEVQEAEEPEAPTEPYIPVLQPESDWIAFRDAIKATGVSDVYIEEILHEVTEADLIVIKRPQVDATS